MPHFSFHGSHYNPNHGSHYDPNQPRAPRGQRDGGQWTEGGVAQNNEDEDASVQPVFLQGPAFSLATRLGPLILPRLGAVLADGFRLLTWLSRLNGPDRQAFVAFRAHEFQGAAPEFVKIEGYGLLPLEEADKLCRNGLSKVQTLVDKAMKNAGPRKPNESAQAYGTRVHGILQALIDNGAVEGVDKGEFRAEISFGVDDELQDGKDADKIKEGIRRGKKNSIRIDVIQDLGGKTVCVYDLKTGLRGLSIPRAKDFADKILQARNSEGRAKQALVPGKQPEGFVKVERIIVTEMRPSEPLDEP